MKKKTGLGKKISALIVSGMTALALLLVGFSWWSMRNSYISFYAQKAQNTSRMLADLVNGDRIGAYLETGKKDGYYEELEHLFGKMKEDSGAAFTYIFYPMEDRFVYILDGRTGSDDRNTISRLGDIYEYGETEYRYLYPDVLRRRASDGIILGRDVGFGESVSAWAPVLDSRGNLAAMVEADYYLEEVNREIALFLIRFLAILFTGMGGIVLLLLAGTRKMVSGPMESLTGAIASFRDGGFQLPEGKLDTGDEIQILYEAFADMAEKIDRYVKDIARIAGEKERIGAELAIATQIQADMLPSIFPAFPGRNEIDIYAVMQPAKEVGGDFYDFFLINGHMLAAVIADVSGKGVPAALFMVIARTLIKNHAELQESPAEIFENVNRQLCEGNREGFFVTAWLGILDLRTGKTDYVNAGHNPPLLLRADGEVCWLRTVSGFVLAGMEEMDYRQDSFYMEPGDRLFLYTDGVTESRNKSDELYGEERLLGAMEGCRGFSVQHSVERLMLELTAFAGGAEQFDDITMLEVEYRREKKEKNGHCGEI